MSSTDPEANIDPSGEKELYQGYSVDDEDQPAAEDFMLDEEVDEAERGYSPPESYSRVHHHGATAHEQAVGETLEERLKQEQPDPDPFDLPPEDAIVDGDVAGEVGGERAGRLVAPDEGLAEDTEATLIGDDVGIDGAAAGAEEAAVHVIPADDDEDATRPGDRP